MSVGCSSDNEPEMPKDPEAPIARPAKFINQSTAVGLASKALVKFGYLTEEEAKSSTYNVTLIGFEGKTDSLYFEIEFPGVAYVAVDASYYNPVGVVAVCEKTPPMKEVLMNYIPATMQPIDLPSGLLPTEAYVEYSYPTPSWGPKAPYNAYAPMNDSGTKHGTLGQTTVAIGEIMAYYKIPVKVDGKPFDWSGINPFDPDEAGIDKIAGLLNQIGIDASSHYESGYGYYIVGEWSYFQENGFSWSKCNINSLLATDALAKGPAVMSIIRPFILRGWKFVADGMKKWTDGTTSTTYLHYNMGNYGEGNGYYLVSLQAVDKQTKEYCEMILPPDGYPILAVSHQ